MSLKDTISNGTGVDNLAFTPLDELGPERVPSVRGLKESACAFAVSTQQQQHKPQDKYKEGPCGWGRFTPRYLQCCNNPVGYLIFFSLLGVLQGTAVNGLINVSISTIEKRYHLNSSLMGLVVASYDISFCLLSLFVSFYGQRGHKPRWLAFSAFMLGLGSMIFTIPHFATGLYDYGAQLEDICPMPANGTTEMCNTSQASSDSNYLYVFILAQLLMGVGGTPLYTLGTAFFDDSLPAHKASLFIGIGYGMSIIGPAIGYMLGGELLNLYIDFDKVSSVTLTSDDPRWLGSWWIGFLICWIGLWLLIAPLSCFPKHLPGTAKVQANKVSQTHDNGSETYVEEKDIGKTIKDFPVALKVLLKNPVFMCLTIASCSDGLSAGGFTAFLPKFIENQFSQTSSYAAIFAGGVLIPAAAIGQVLGGIIISKTKMHCKNMMKFSVILSVIAFLTGFVFLFTKCGNHPFAGVTEDYNGTGMIGDLKAPCNENCSCLRSNYDPVCGINNVQYFSPCHAGCSAVEFQNGSEVFNNCSCIEKSLADTLFSTEAQSKKCDSLCTSMPIFMAFFFIAVLATFMTATPITMAVLRCVPDKQRSFALGVQWVFIRLLGAIPGPILFGVTIDFSCILWNVKPCGEVGACWTYDNDGMSNYLLAICALCRLIVILFLIVAILNYKSPENKEQTRSKSRKQVASESMQSLVQAKGEKQINLACHVSKIQLLQTASFLSIVCYVLSAALTLNLSNRSRKTQRPKVTST